MKMNELLKLGRNKTSLNASLDTVARDKEIEAEISE